MVVMRKILIVTTSASRLGDTDTPTGVWAEELALPFYFFRTKGYRVTVASIRGGPIPIDPASLEAPHLSITVKRFLADPHAQAYVQRSESIVHLLGQDYDGIYIAGGHGIMWDGPFNMELQRVLSEAWRAGRVIAAVGHGPAALVYVKDQKGQPLVYNRQVTAFSNEEELKAHKEVDQVVPFFLETRLREMGALYSRTAAGMPCAVQAGNLITGQNAPSAGKVAQLLVEALSLGVRMMP